MMKRKLVTMVTILAMIMTLIPAVSLGAYAPPTNFGAPKDITPMVEEDAATLKWTGFSFSASASDEIRSLLDAAAQESSSFNQAGYSLTSADVQVDYKIDNGNWHYTSEWDSNPEIMSGILGLTSGKYSSYALVYNNQFEAVALAGEKLPADKSYFNSHKMEFRIRFVVIYQDEGTVYHTYFSPWSTPVSYSNSAENPVALINHVPVLKSAELLKYNDGTPYLHIVTDKAHADLQHLDSISGDHVQTELWLKVGTGEWKVCATENFVEQFDVMGAQAYFGSQENYDAAVYQIKYRYVFAMENYPPSGKAGNIYSPFSNVISHGMPAYTGASSWSVQYLDKAAVLGIITERLKTKKMSDPITREEFAEAAVLFYELVTGEKAQLANVTFKDTTNPEIIKAFGLKITTGVGDGTRFEPNAFLQRQQMAAMITRTLKACYPDIVFNITGQPDFKDQSKFGAYAITPAKFMAKHAITVGDGKGNFDPIGACTREQAMTFFVRAFEMKNNYEYK
ncbi:MAG: S-layer homology domain-containing protein [Clostridia bacterium]|nr:S-layer homology domain-containing protein [Clostridia bacterium]